MRKLLLLIILLAALVPALTAAAQNSSGATDDDVNDVARQLFCPVCENIPLDVCPTAACADWRQEIRVQLNAGRTQDQIISDFISRFGERVVGTPHDPLLRSLSLLTPGLIGLVVLAIAGFTFARWTRTGGVRANTPTRVETLLSEDEYRQQIERDLLARR